MKITKYVHSCLLVETPDRVALFDPGVMSTPELDINSISHLDDLFITHIHPDHYDKEYIKKLVAKFPGLRITAPAEVVEDLAKEGIDASDHAPQGVAFFDSPHEKVDPVFPPPQEIGIHYLDKLTDPGDSHSFKETKAILALPITAPWGSAVRACNLALELKPKHVLPIHDWHWHDQARQQMYDKYAGIMEKEGIVFHKLVNGQPVEIDV
jgi:L-ascorbate metabolism protein UlaG (beta-lactamase superfamily)